MNRQIGLLVATDVHGSAFHMINESADALPAGVLMRMKGTFVPMGVKGNNGRWYDYESYNPHVDSIRPAMARKELLGENEHPIDRAHIDYTLATHRIEEVTWEPNTKTYVGVISILDTIEGRKIYDVAKSGTPMYVSHRALGTWDKQSGRGIIMKLITWDLTSHPSFSAAQFGEQFGTENVSAINESTVFIRMDESALTMLAGTEGMTVDEMFAEKPLEDDDVNESIETPQIGWSYKGTTGVTKDKTGKVVSQLPSGDGYNIDFGNGDIYGIMTSRIEAGEFELINESTGDIFTVNQDFSAYDDADKALNYVAGDIVTVNKQGSLFTMRNLTQKNVAVYTWTGGNPHWMANLKHTPNAKLNESSQFNAEQLRIINDMWINKSASADANKVINDIANAINADSDDVKDYISSNLNESATQDIRISVYEGSYPFAQEVLKNATLEQAKKFAIDKIVKQAAYRKPSDTLWASFSYKATSGQYTWDETDELFKHRIKYKDGKFVNESSANRPPKKGGHYNGLSWPLKPGTAVTVYIEDWQQRDYNFRGGEAFKITGSGYTNAQDVNGQKATIIKLEDFVDGKLSGNQLGIMYYYRLKMAKGYEISITSTNIRINDYADFVNESTKKGGSVKRLKLNESDDSLINKIDEILAANNISYAIRKQMRSVVKQASYDVILDWFDTYVKVDVYNKIVKLIPTNINESDADVKAEAVIKKLKIDLETAKAIDDAAAVKSINEQLREAKTAQQNVGTDTDDDNVNESALKLSKVFNVLRTELKWNLSSDKAVSIAEDYNFEMYATKGLRKSQTSILIEYLAMPGSSVITDIKNALKKHSITPLQVFRGNERSVNSFSHDYYIEIDNVAIDINESSNIMQTVNDVISTVLKAERLTSEQLKALTAQHTKEFTDLFTGTIKHLSIRYSGISYIEATKLKLTGLQQMSIVSKIGKQLIAKNIAKQTDFEPADNYKSEDDWNIVATKLYKPYVKTQFDLDIEQLANLSSEKLDAKEFAEYLNDYENNPAEYGIKTNSAYYKAIAYAHNNLAKYYTAYDVYMTTGKFINESTMSNELIVDNTYKLGKMNQHGFLNYDEAKNTKFAGNNKLDSNHVVMPYDTIVKIISIEKSGTFNELFTVKVIRSSNADIVGKTVYSTELTGVLGFASLINESAKRIAMGQTVYAAKDKHYNGFTLAKNAKLTRIDAAKYNILDINDNVSAGMWFITDSKRYLKLDSADVSVSINESTNKGGSAKRLRLNESYNA